LNTLSCRCCSSPALCSSYLVLNASISTMNYTPGRTIAEAVSCWLLTSAARVRQVRFVVDKVASGQVFSKYFSFPGQNHFITPTSPSSQSPGADTQRPCDEVITRPRSPADCPRCGNRNEMKSFVQAAKGPKLGCRAVGGRTTPYITKYSYVPPHFYRTCNMVHNKIYPKDRWDKIHFALFCYSEDKFLNVSCKYLCCGLHVHSTPRLVQCKVKQICPPTILPATAPQHTSPLLTLLAFTGPLPPSALSVHIFCYSVKAGMSLHC
jgi:hypothetical protein